MKVADIVSALEALAPPALAEEWDNVGLLIGDAQASTGRLLLCIDVTAPVLAEAKALGAGMVMAYHPVIFKPVAKLTASAAPVAYAAARAGLAVYSMHTALDAAPEGTNDVLADVLGLTDCRPLEPAVRKSQCKIVVFVRPEDMSTVADAAFGAGAGRIGHYDRCAFFGHGVGTFHSGMGTHPAVGLPGRQEATEEMRLEIVAPRSASAAVCQAVRAVHSYEEPAIDVYPLEDYPAGCGIGRVGRLARPAGAAAVIARIKKALGLERLWVAQGIARRPSLAAASGGGSQGWPPPTTGNARSIKHGDKQRRHATLITTAACCAGSCGSLAGAAARAGAQLYLTGEMRHHDALSAAAAGMTVVCVGHSNSERPALERLAARLSLLRPKLDVVLSKQDKDPLEIV
jgi:putative NIF3 family GTP cyclohydrolase 1 type 2